MPNDEERKSELNAAMEEEIFALKADEIITVEDVIEDAEDLENALSDKRDGA